jgi:two-component system LytT family sensor kinase
MHFATERGFFVSFTEKAPPPSELPHFPMLESTIFGIPKGFFLLSLNRILSFSLFVFLISGLMRLGASFIKNRNEKRALENARLNSEVKFLRSQINPHFLFNTLNGIYSLAHERSAETETAILKLSDMMRYVLYDSSEEKVALEKDIEYLTNYLDLQRLRLSSKVDIQYELKGDIRGYYIAPLILIPFVENAFKHGISYAQPSSISIHISVFKESLTLLVDNPIIESNRFSNGGVGLKNVTRQLDLLYPGRHSLNVVRTNNMHIVNLKIVL